MKKIAILIPSYKRPFSLLLTLRGLLGNTRVGDEYEVSISVGLNQGSPEDQAIINQMEVPFEEKGIKLNSVSYEKNIGKATILNILQTLYAEDADYIITMDNDMVIMKPWLHLVSQSNYIDYDIMGFCSVRFWAHDPIRDNCNFVKKTVDGKDYRFYTPVSVAGGMMLFHSKFFKSNPCNSSRGFYGKDSASMPLITQKKYVLHSEEDWLIHDPLKDSGQ
jgi:hypothetical protein